MLPAEKGASSPSLGLSRQQSQDDNHRPVLRPFTDIELEANAPRDPELDAEAPGPHILEAETMELVHEMESNHPPVAEMDGWRRSEAMAEGRNGWVAEL